jgi:hypothetical protein
MDCWFSLLLTDVLRPHYFLGTHKVPFLNLILGQ